MQKLAKTIQIFLPSGDPAGVQVAELTTGILQLIEVPRKLIHEFGEMPQAKQVGIYFLVGEDSETGEPVVYIGQSGSVGRRLEEHHKSNKFEWSRVLVAVSLKHSFTSTHVLHLEWQCIQEANQAQRYKVVNGNAGSKPYAPLPLEADCAEFFQSIRMLLSTLGQRFLEGLAEQAPASSAGVNTLISQAPKAYFCGNKEGITATGQYTAEGMVVLKGSKARVAVTPSYGKSVLQRREQLIADGSLALDCGVYVFTKDVGFGSPSGASDMVLGRSSNGWIEWLDTRGATLDTVERQSSAGVSTDGLSQ